MATRIKRYEERLERLDALLARIEAEMGPYAELETREFVRGRFMGIFGGARMVEVIATLEVDGESTPETQPDRAGRIQPPFAFEPESGARAAAEPRNEAGYAATQAPAPAGAPSQHIDLQADEPASVLLDAAPEPEPDRAASESAPLFTPASAAAPPPAPGQPATLHAELPAYPTLLLEPSAGPAASPEPEGQPSPVQPPEEGLPAAQIKDLQQSISELQQTMQQFIEHQRSINAVVAAQAVQPAPEPLSGPVTGNLFAEFEEEASAGDLAGVPDALSIDAAAGLTNVQRTVYDRLLDWNIGPYDSMELLNKALESLPSETAPSLDDLMQAVTRDICRNILLGGGIKLRKSPQGKVVALIGATGVGKTTTIAKLAAHFSFNEGKRVSLISLDNYRIAAAEQLRTYTDIMGIELDIVFSRDEFDLVLTERSHNDLILIDTAGRSPLNDRQIYELKDIFSAHPPDEVHLVIAAPTKADDLRLILENFAPLGYDHIIVSKLDETRSLGCVYNINKYAAQAGGRGVPISYFTVGQSVPEDIRMAQPGFIQAWIEQGRIM